MATYATLTINAADIIGADFDRSRCSAYIETNTPHGLVIVNAENIRLGGRRENPDATGTITFPNLVTTNSADNPTSFAYKVTIVYVPKGSRKQGHDSITTSEFPLLANADLAAIAEAWDDVTIPVSWRSDFRDEMEAIEAATEAHRTAVENVVITDLGTTDGQTKTLIETDGTLTKAALSATYAGREGLGVVMIDTAEETLTGTDIAPIGSIDGVTYGNHLTSGALYSSTTNGDTWTLVNTVGGYGIHPLGDGEVLLNSGATLKKSSGWDVDPTTAAFSTVATANGSATFLASTVETHDNIVIAAEYAVPRTDARYVKVSTDYGATFTNVRDLNTMYPGYEAESHWHAVCIDHYHDGPNPRLWAAHGDNATGFSSAVIYSDDLGGSWTTYTTVWQPMPMIALPAGIVTSTDQNAPDGIWVIPRDLSERRLLAQIPAPVWLYSLLGFGIAAIRDDQTGTAYITFRSEAFSHFTDTLPAYIFATDGVTADLIYSTEQRTTVGTNNSLNWEGSPALTTDGYLLGVYTAAGTRYRVRGRVASGAPSPRAYDAGNALTGQADHSSVAAGAGAVAAGGSVVLGAGAVQTDDIGTGDFSNVVIGTGADGSNYSVALGVDATTGPYATACGYQAAAAGSDAVAIGRGASAAGNDNVAIGHNASAPAGVNNTVALGYNTVATEWNQVAIGARHLEIRTIGGEPPAPAVSAARMWVRDRGDGYKEMCVRFPSGTIKVIATEA